LYHARRHFRRRRLLTNVPGLVWRVGANHEKVGTGFEPAVSGPGGQYSDVACIDFDFVAVRSAKHEACCAAGKAEHLVSGGVIMVEGIDTVAPLRGPAGAPEDGLVCRRWIVACGIDDAAIEKNRQSRVVRHPAVRSQLQNLWLQRLR
jgi:hypothetical protein